jgi:hypothetical protein
MHADSLRMRFARYPEAEMVELLDELVERGLLETVEANERQDLDFTNSFNVADLRKAAKGQELDFTNSFNLSDLRKAGS